MQYDKEILRVLAEAGNEGLSVKKISRHVFNACNSLFCPINSMEVHTYVQSFLLRNSKSVPALIEKCKKGVYRLNKKNSFTEQMFFQFQDEIEVFKSQPTEDKSLNLFDF